MSIMRELKIFLFICWWAFLLGVFAPNLISAKSDYHVAFGIMILLVNAFASYVILRRELEASKFKSDKDGEPK